MENRRLPCRFLWFMKNVLQLFFSKIIKSERFYCSGHINIFHVSSVITQKGKSQGTRNFRFSENLICSVFFWPLSWDSPFLPYDRPYFLMIIFIFSGHKKRSVAWDRLYTIHHEFYLKAFRISSSHVILYSEI